MKNVTLFASGVALVLFTVILGLQGRNLLSQALYTLLVVLPLGVGWIAVRAYGLDSVHGKFLGLMLVGIGLWSLGEVLWFLFEWVLGIDPFPSIADVFYLAGYIPMLLAIRMQIAHVGLSSLFKHKGVFVPVAFLFISLVAVVSYMGMYLAYSQEAGFWINAISIAYGVGDLLLVVCSLLLMAVMHAYKGGKITTILSFLVAGFVVTLVADMGFSLYYASYGDGLSPFIYLDVLWVAAYLCFLVAYSYAYSLARAIRLQVTRITSYAR